MKKIVALFIIFYSVNANAQTATDSIKNIINQLFIGMKNSDTALIKQCFTPTAQLQTFARNRTSLNNIFIKEDKLNDFLQQVSKIPKDSADERIQFEHILVDGPLASVWAPYDFYFNHKFSHCGINHFVMARLEGEWKIHFLIDTRRRQGCGK
jgi:hypothetical protein